MLEHKIRRESHIDLVVRSHVFTGTERRENHKIADIFGERI